MIGLGDLCEDADSISVFIKFMGNKKEVKGTSSDDEKIEFNRTIIFENISYKDKITIYVESSGILDDDDLLKIDKYPFDL